MNAPLPSQRLPDAALERYLAQLPLSTRERAQLEVGLRALDPAQRFAALHEQLAGRRTHPPALGSVPRRLQDADGRPRVPLHEDNHGRLRLVSTPPLQRAVMLPQPLLRNPLARLWRALIDILNGRRGHMASTQDLLADLGPDRKGRWHRTALLRRLLLLGLVLAQAGVGTWFMTFVLPYHGAHPLEQAILVVYAVLFGWVSAGFWTALLGFLVLLRGGDHYSITTSAPPGGPLPADARTAILVPICNEDVPRVFAGLKATYESLQRSGERERFDFFILSDTNLPDLRVAELEAWAALCRQVQGFDHIFYRRRVHRLKRKSGNIADWCRRWGSRYRYMVVLDADSVMSGSCLVRLVQLMEANPGCGIIQTAPQATGRETFYARLQQFAHRVYGPLFTAGLHFWQLGESHYWGHNAILRVAPFIRHCGLTKLPGKGPLAGEILSHDFVEAALMRRAGWSVWMAYDLPGSYEEMPPTLLEELKRDRRWCQGNLQNVRLFLAQGLHPAHRAVFMTGLMSYLSAPLWLLFLVLSTALLAVHTLVPPQYFTQPWQLFPVWPEWRPEWALSLFAATAVLLLLPKLLAALLLLRRPRPYGGRLRLLLSTLVEIVFSALLAPIRMLFHSGFVLSALLGRSVRWLSPPRDDAETPWSEALRRHLPGTLLGLAWAILVYALNPAFLWWLLPVAGSLIASIPLSVWSSRVRLGRWLRQRQLFLIPEEYAPPAELQRLEAALVQAPAHEDGLRRACVDPGTNALVCAAGRLRRHLPPALDEQRRRLAQAALARGPGGLSPVEGNLLLSDPIALARLHELVWTSEAAHPGWLRPSDRHFE